MSELINKNPHKCGGRTLLAKTCPSCGFFLDARCFTKYLANKSRGYKTYAYETMCRWCKSKVDVSNRRGSIRKQYPKKKGFDQEIDTSRTGTLWTEEDIYIVSDPSKTYYQKCVEVKRTLEAVYTMCHKEGFRSLDARMLGPNNEYQWQIKFPNAVSSTSGSEGE